MGVIKGRIRNVLDCGTGTGALLAAWTRTVSDVSTPYAADMSLKMGLRTRNALQALGKRVRFIVGDGEALPFDSRSMHLVMCAYALGHMENPPAGVAEM